MIRIGQTLFKERAYLINRQLALAREIKLENQTTILSKPPLDFSEVSKLQEEIREKERAITLLSDKYSLNKKIN